MKEYIKNLTPETVISRLKQGEILTDGEKTIEYIDGLLVAKRDDDWAINPAISKSFDDFYFYRPAPELELEIGKFYKTRDGKKAYVFAVNSAGKFNVAIEGEGAYSVFAGGYYSEEEETDGDLIGLWAKPTEKRTNFDGENYNRIKELIDRGLNMAEISRALNKNANTVYAYLKYHEDLADIYYSIHGKRKMVNININELVKEAIIEKFDEDIFIEQLSMDIHQSNPDWWIEHIVNPLKDILLDAILNNKDFLKEVIDNLFDREASYDRLMRILEDKAEQRMRELMPNVSVKIEGRD